MPVKRAAYVILVLAVGAIFLFSACSQKAKKPEDVFAGKSGNYSTDARISYKRLKAEAKISQETPAACSMIFESPASLKDMEFLFRRDSVDLSYKGLSFSFEQDFVPAAAVAKLTVSAINRAMRDDGLQSTLDGGVMEITGTLENGAFILRVDRETGSLIKLLIPAEELEIEFGNFTFLD